MATKKLKKKQKIRNNEYYKTQEVFDNLYAKARENKSFTNLLEIITSEENILLAYRNIKKNKGSKTSGTNKTTIIEIGKNEPKKLISYVRKRLENFYPQPVKRVEIEKDNGKLRPLGIPTIANFFIAYWPYILGIFTGGIGLVIGLVIQNWDSIKAKTAEIWNSIKETLSAFWTDLKEKFTSGIDSIKELWNNLKEFLKNPIQGTVKLFKKTSEDTSDVTTDGSHKTGLARVPFDGYIAELHKNERVLTADESKTYSNIGTAFRSISTIDKRAVIDGSHKAGLASVPFDGYIAELHKNERVLTKEENQDYLKNSNNSSASVVYNNDFDINIYADGKTADEIVDELVPRLKLALGNL